MLKPNTLNTKKLYFGQVFNPPVTVIKPTTDTKK